jgi:hypothetical protein
MQLGKFKNNYCNNKYNNNKNNNNNNNNNNKNIIIIITIYILKSFLYFLSHNLKELI